MLFRKFDEETSKQELLAIVKEMSALDESYPRLGVPSQIREMLDNGNFDVEERPWDFLVALAYSIISLCSEEAGGGKEIDRLQKRISKILKHPMKWMYDAITVEVQNRYFKVAGKDIPRVVVTRRRLPRSLKGKCEIFAWHEYEQLQYVLRRMRDIPYLISLSTSYEDDRFSSIITVRAMRDLIASMENPPRSVLEELNREAIRIELEALRKDLKHAQTKAQNLASLEYAADCDTAELNMLSAIAMMLGVDVQFPK